MEGAPVRPKEPTRISNLRKRLQRIEQTKHRCREGGPPPDRRQLAALGFEQAIREEILQWEQFGILETRSSPEEQNPEQQQQHLLLAAGQSLAAQHLGPSGMDDPSFAAPVSGVGLPPAIVMGLPALATSSSTSSGLPLWRQPLREGPAAPILPLPPSYSAAALPGSVSLPPPPPPAPPAPPPPPGTVMDLGRVWALAYPQAPRMEKEPTRIVNLRRRLQRILSTKERLANPNQPPPDNRQLSALAAEAEIVWEIEQWEQRRIIYPQKPEMRYIPPGGSVETSEVTEDMQATAETGSPGQPQPQLQFTPPVHPAHPQVVLPIPASSLPTPQHTSLEDASEDPTSSQLPQYNSAFEAAPWRATYPEGNLKPTAAGGARKVNLVITAPPRAVHHGPSSGGDGGLPVMYLHPPQGDPAHPNDDTGPYVLACPPPSTTTMASVESW
eukprot:RCo044829